MSPPAGCRLCLAEGLPLKRSHISPKWGYKRLRDAAAVNGNPNPILITRAGAVQTSDQIAEVMLCDSCEQDLSKTENYVTHLVHRSDGSMPFLQRLSVQDTATKNGVRVAAASPADIEQLRRFAYSVLWRAHHSRDVDRCDLGPYAEAVRSFLHTGAALGKRFVSIITYLSEPATQPDLALGFTMPTSRRVAGGHLHWFLFLGFRFDFMIGQKIPERFVDTHASEEGRLLVALGSSDQFLLPQLRRFLKDTPLTLRRRR